MKKSKHLKRKYRFHEKNIKSIIIVYCINLFGVFKCIIVFVL